MDLKEVDKQFLLQAIEMAVHNAEQGNGGPFAALVVKDQKVIASGCNFVTTNNDPTAHAEVVAIRNACKALGSYQLKDCTLYASCEPCPMCLGAIYWARPSRLVFAADKFQAAQAGFDDAFIYQEIALSPCCRSLTTEQIAMVESQEPFNLWMSLTDKKKY